MTQLLHYYRCPDCLSIATAAEYQNKAECGLCAGRLEYMGRVQGARLVQDRELCKCDGRCIFAKGPNCDCSCCGDNHGAGWFGGGFETVTVDVGAVPRLRMPDNSQAATIAAEYRSGLAAMYEAARAADVGRDWRRRYELANAIDKVRTARIHKNRMAVILATLPEFQPTTRAELQPSLF